VLIINTCILFIGLFLEKIALLTNIYRWELILKVSGAIKSGVTISKNSD